MSLSNNDRIKTAYVLTPNVQSATTSGPTKDRRRCRRLDAPINTITKTGGLRRQAAGGWHVCSLYSVWFVENMYNYDFEFEKKNI